MHARLQENLQLLRDVEAGGGFFQKRGTRLRKRYPTGLFVDTRQAPVWARGSLVIQAGWKLHKTSLGTKLNLEPFGGHTKICPHQQFSTLFPILENPQGLVWACAKERGTLQWCKHGTLRWDLRIGNICTPPQTLTLRIRVQQLGSFVECRCRRVNALPGECFASNPSPPHLFCGESRCGS